MELELIAILAVIFTLSYKQKKVVIYTDNLGIYQTWNKLFNEASIVWMTRQIWNFNYIGLWKLIYKYIKDHDMTISVFKVKSHSNNLGNDIADSLCKAAFIKKDNVVFLILL
jgi:ribonuclease HI